MLSFFYRLTTRYVLPIGIGLYAYSFYQRVQEGEDCFILFCHDFIQGWSYVEIMVNKMWNKRNEFLEICNEYIYHFGGMDMQPEPEEEEEVNKIEYIKNGKKIVQFNHGDECDFVIYSKHPPGGKCVLKKIIYTKQKTNTQSQSTQETLATFDTITKWKFLSLEIIANVNGLSMSFKINLHTNDYDFYQDGNILTPEFFHYYLQNLYSPAIETDSLHIDTLTIVDSNVTYTIDTFQPNERLEIGLFKDDYTITKVTKN